MKQTFRKVIAVSGLVGTLLLSSGCETAEIERGGNGGFSIRVTNSLTRKMNEFFKYIPAKSSEGEYQCALLLYNRNMKAVEEDLALVDIWDTFCNGIVDSVGLTREDSDTRATYVFDAAKCLLSPVFDKRKCILSCAQSCDAYRSWHVDEMKLTDEADMLINDFYGKHNVKALIHGKHEIKSILKEK